MQQADRLILNVLSNYLLTLVAGVAGLVMVPVVLGELGAAGYGLAALLQAAFISVRPCPTASGALCSAYVPHDLASADPQRVNATFSSGMAWFAALGAAGALLVLGFRGDLPRRTGHRRGAARRGAASSSVWCWRRSRSARSLNVYRAGSRGAAALRPGVAARGYRHRAARRCW